MFLKTALAKHYQHAGVSPSVPSCSSSLGIFSGSGLRSSSCALLPQTSAGCSELYPDSSMLQQSQACTDLIKTQNEKKKTAQSLGRYLVLKFVK